MLKAETGHGEVVGCFRKPGTFCTRNSRILVAGTPAARSPPILRHPPTAAACVRKRKSDRYGGRPVRTRARVGLSALPWLCASKRGPTPITALAKERERGGGGRAPSSYPCERGSKKTQARAVEWLFMGFDVCCSGCSVSKVLKLRQSPVVTRRRAWTCACLLQIGPSATCEALRLVRMLLRLFLQSVPVYTNRACHFSRLHARILAAFCRG